MTLAVALALAALGGQAIDVRGFSQLAPLDGVWRMSADDDPRFAEAEFDDSSWRAVRVPGDELAGAWLRFKVRLPEARPAELALLLPPLGTSYELFLNGQPAGMFGNPRLPGGWGDFYTPAAAMFPIPAPSGALTIAIRSRRLVPANPAPPGARHAWIGTPAAVAEKLRQVELEVRWRTAGHLVGLGATAVAGLFFVLLPLWRRDAREFFWCGAFLLVIVLLRPQSVAPWMLEGFPLPWVLCGLFGFLLPYQYCWERLLSELLGVPLSAGGRWLFRGLLLLTAALCLLSPFFTVAIAPFFATHVLLMLAVLVLVYADLAARSRRMEETPWMHLAVAFLHGGNLLYFLLFSPWGKWLLPVGAGVQDMVLTARGGGSFLFTGVMMVVLNRRSARLQREQERLALEMRAGAEMQALLLPASSVEAPGFATESVYLPMSEVGGDFHWVRADPDGGLIVVVGDVSGKGLKAAMLVSVALGVLRTVKSSSPAVILETLNDALAGQMRAGFVTCCCGRFAPGGAVTLANAGHPAPYGDGLEIAMEAGLPLGVVAGVVYAECEAAGERFTFVSDGVVEAENAARELFGFDRTREISRRPASEIAEAARAWGQTDDITVVTVRSVR